MKYFILLIFLFSQNSYSIEEDSIEFLQWYNQKKELYTSSKKYINRLKRKLDADQIIGLELIIAEATDEQVESKFGHALFRFVDNDNNPGNDITISFVADVNGPQASNIGGVIGKYGVYPEVKSLRLFIKQYIKNQSRPLERHIIPSNKLMKHELVTTLFNWWEEINKAREAIYKQSVVDAMKSAKDKGKILFGEDNFELFEIKVFDDEANKEVTQSIGIVQIEETPFRNDNQRDNALYRQAYTKAINTLNIKKENIVLNLYREIWKINIDDEILDIKTTDINQATNNATNYFKTSNIKLFKKHNSSLVLKGYYAMTLEKFRRLNITEKVKIKLNIKNLRVNRVISESLGKYTFFSNNCAGAVINFLKRSNFPHKRTVGLQGRIPVKLNKWMSRSLLVPYPSLVLDKSKSLREKVARILGFSGKEFEEYSFPLHQWSIISTYLSDNDKFLFYELFAHKLSEEYTKKVRVEIEPLTAPSYSKLYGLNESSPIFYTLCKNKECIEQVKTDLVLTWSKKEIKKVKKLINRTGNNTFIYKGLIKNKEILRHLKLLDYIPQDFQ